MNRRGLIGHGTALFSVGLSGCLDSLHSTDDGGDGEDTAISTSEGATEIKIESSVEEELAVDLTVHRNDEVTHTEQMDVPPSQSTFADYEITETGVYDVVLKTDSGREGSTQVSVGEYALNHGRDIVIAVTSGMIRGYIQE